MSLSLVPLPPALPRSGNRAAAHREKAFPFWKSFLCVVLVGVLVFLSYSPVVHGDFLWDDGYLVAGNAFIRSPWLLLECFRHFLFSDSVSQFYRPTQNLSYFLDYWRGGLDPAVFHQTNILLQALNAALLFVLSRRWLKTEKWQIPLAISAIWALHPIHSATVAYIAGRADSLALLFFLSAWWCWENGLGASTKPRAAVFFSAAIVAAVFATCSKEIAVEGLLLFLVHLWTVRPDLTQKQRLRSSLGAVILFLIYLVLRHLPESNISPGASPGLPALDRLNLFFRALGDYLRLLVWPDRLYMERQIIDQGSLLRQVADFDALFPWLGWMGGFFLLLLIAAMLWRAEGQRLRIFGASWFLIMILPVSNLFALNATVAEHWLYFPSVGFLLCLAGVWEGLCIRHLAIPAFLVVLAISGLGIRTWIRANDWKDGFTFYTATIRDGGDSVRMRINLAAEYRKRGQGREADRLYRSILAKMPAYTWVRYLLIDNLRAEGRAAEAELLLTKTPKNPVGDLKASDAYVQQLMLTGKLDEALKTIRPVYESHPDSWAAVNLLSHILRRQNRIDSATLIVQGFAERHWWHAESHQILGELLAGKGRSEQAIVAWQQAARLDIRNAHPLAMIAALLADLGEFTRAVEFQEKAVKRQPTPSHRQTLGELREAARQEALPH